MTTYNMTTEQAREYKRLEKRSRRSLEQRKAFLEFCATLERYTPKRLRVGNDGLVHGTR